MSDVVIFQVQDSLSVLDNSRSITSNEELDRLGHSIVTQESSRLTPDQLSGGGRNWDEETRGGLLVVCSFGFGGTREFDVYEVDLKLLLCLDSDEHGGSSSGDDNFVRVVGGLEDEGERSFLQEFDVSVSSLVRNSLTQDARVP